MKVHSTSQLIAMRTDRYSDFLRNDSISSTHPVVTYMHGHLVRVGAKSNHKLWLKLCSNMVHLMMCNQLLMPHHHYRQQTG